MQHKYVSVLGYGYHFEISLNSLPDGDDLPLAGQDTPGAVEPWGVVQWPGGAVDDPSPLRVHLHLPTARCGTRGGLYYSSQALLITATADAWL